jgi:hypothetical protein
MDKAFREPDLFPPSGERVEDTYSVESVKKPNFNHWTISNGPSRVGVSHPSPEDGNVSGSRNFMLFFFVVQNTGK